MAATKGGTSVRQNPPRTQVPSWRDDGGSVGAAISRFPERKYPGPVDYIRVGDYEGLPAFDDLCQRLKHHRISVAKWPEMPAKLDDFVAPAKVGEQDSDKDVPFLSSQHSGAIPQKSIPCEVDVPTKKHPTKEHSSSQIQRVLPVAAVNEATVKPTSRHEFLPLLEEESTVAPPRKRNVKKRAPSSKMEDLPALPGIDGVASFWQMSVTSPKDLLAARPVVPSPEPQSKASSSSGVARFRKGPALRKIWRQNRSVNAKAAGHLDGTQYSPRFLHGAIPEANRRVFTSIKHNT